MDDVRVAILTGAGRVFSAGADIKARAAAAPTLGGDRQHLRSAWESYYAIMECRKPVIAAINGAALGAGLALVASCDILVAAEEAELGLPEVPDLVQPRPRSASEGKRGAEPPGATRSALLRASMARMASTGPSPQ